MGIGNEIKDKATKMAINAVLGRYIDFIVKDPEQNFDKAIESLKKLEHTIGGTDNLSKFADWVQKNPGSRQWLINLFKKDKHVVKTFFTNFLVNVNLGWIKYNKEETISKNGFAAPYTILISPTMRCNLNCIGCYASEYSRQDDMPIELVDSIITQGKEIGTYFYTILGGEPFVRWAELYPLIKKHNDSLFMIFTNSTFITDKVADQIQELGNVYPVLSVNGWEDETDYIRGKGIYAKVIQAADRLKERGIIFGNSFVFMRTNFDQLTSDELYDFWIEKGAFFSWLFLFMPVGRDPEVDLMPLPSQRKAMGDFVRSLRARKPYFLMDFWNDAPSVGGCIAGGRRYLHINSEGYVEPCIFTHFATDNIKEKSLVDILKSPFLTDIRFHQPHSDNLLTPCMIIDNPWVLREVVAKHHAISTDKGASNLVVTKLAPSLDEYSKNIHKELDPVWETEFTKNIEEIKQKGASHGEGLDRLWFQNNPDKIFEWAKKYPFILDYDFLQAAIKEAKKLEKADVAAGK
jgi:MoaA/NifB/PqqE/SkfB family radical SAM enzyme